MHAKLFRDDEEKQVNVHAWVFEPGVPANIPVVKSSALEAVTKQLDAWKGGGPTSAIDASKWSTHEWLHFLRALPDTISRERMVELDRAFKLSASGNSEILFQWLEVAIRNRYEPAFPALEKFLTSQGRRKFVAPLYADLAKTDWGKKMAMDIYRRARPTYHPVAVGTIDQALKWNGKK
jgi:hypothetical protein